jgi:K(+)-stimulated pyrophosphate-energized sodium pump
VAMNPIIKFTTLFGLLAVELAVRLDRTLSAVLAAVFFVISMVFVWRSFYSMRIRAERAPAAEKATTASDAA